MELDGAAWATALARTLTLIPVLVILARRFEVLPSRGERGAHWATLGRLWRVAWPSSAQFVVRIVAVLITVSVVARAFTTPEDQSASTALGVALRLETWALFVKAGAARPSYLVARTSRNRTIAHAPRALTGLN